MPFQLGSAPPPAGDQPRAIRELSAGLRRGDKYQTLLGVTGSGKTMTMAHVIADLGQPTLVLSHNKTLAAQLYGELEAFFPPSLVAVQSQRNDVGFERGTFRVRGDTVEIFPAYDEQAVRIEFWGDAIERIAKIDPLTGTVIVELERCAIYPATHFVTQRATIERAVSSIRAELHLRLAELRSQNKLLEAQRLGSRTHFDIDMPR